MDPEHADVTALCVALAMRYGAVSDIGPASEVMQVLDEFVAAVTTCVTEHGGTVTHCSGEEITAVFGAPARVSDASLAAVNAALELRELFSKLDWATHSPLQVCSGIHEGHAVVGQLTVEGRPRLTALGPGVDLAHVARWRSRPDRILITQPVWDKLGERVDATPLDPVPVKGTSEPMGLYEVHGLRGS